MNKITFKSKYSASVWDIKIVDQRKDNKHTCGAYAINILHQVSKYSMRKNTKENFIPLLGSLIDELNKLTKIVEENNILIDALYSDTAMSQEALILLASKNNGGGWPCEYSSYYPMVPSSLMLANIFSILDVQCLAVDALIRTGWLESSKGGQIHKRLAKPIRAYMQQSITIYKEHKSLEHT